MQVHWCVYVGVGPHSYLDREIITINSGLFDLQLGSDFFVAVEKESPVLPLASLQYHNVVEFKVIELDRLGFAHA